MTSSSRRISLALGLCSLSLLVLPVPLFAAQQTGTITIEQSGKNGILGQWVLIKPENKRLTLRSETHTISDAALGNYTLLVEPPAGAETTVRVFLEQDLLSTHSKPQASFTLEQNMHIRVRVEYNFLRVGVVGVNSQPPGIGFTLRGPNNLETSGTTPQSYNEMPEGQYTVTYTKIPDCPEAKPLSDKLISGGRANFSITFHCDGLKFLEQQATYEKTYQYVTTQVNGTQITFQDVPLSEWFAPSVNIALKTGIMSGFKDEQGNVTGRFGPGENVTIAQLAKISHELANIDETKAKKRPVNLRALDTWFEQYFASAEERDWLVFQDHRINPDRPATRGEVVATLLQALDVRIFWPKGDMFTDVRRNTNHASCIETAAVDGIVSGFTDGNGASTGKFGPDMPVNRAEMAKMIATAIDVYGE